MDMSMFHQKNSSKTSQSTLKVVAAGFFAFALMGSASAQIKASGGGYLMRVKYVKGQTLKYKTVTSMVNSKDQKAKPLKIDCPIVMKVSNVVKSLATVAATVGPVTMGKTVIQPAQDAEIKLDTKNSPSGGAMPSTSQLVSATFPAKAVKIGTTWSNVTGIPSVTGGMANAKATYKFGGLKTVNGKSMAVVTFTLSGEVSGTGTLLLLASDGTLYSNKTRILFNAGANGTMVINSELTRI
ncbi:hypothetical protein BH11ARM1_BH11ARM1_11310 [soil metagenome]